MTADAPITADYEFIDTPAHLESWLDQMRRWLAASPDQRCCLDTEADSLHHYHEKLCLLQVNCAGRYALVDPLAITDVSALLDLLDSHELWFHGADYDLTMLRRTYGWSPKVVRDTQIAARLLGARQFGLAALVKNVFDLELCKASQKADWSRRPLPPNMLSYAVDDVRYLLPIADKFVAELREKGRESWFHQSCSALQEDVAARDTAAREDPWRVQGCGRLHPRGLALLKGLWEWREGIAKERDLPCFKIMSNKQMTAYAEQFEAGHPLNPPNGWRPRWKKEFHDIVVAVTSSDPASWPARPKKTKGRLSDAQRDQIDKLCAYRETVAQKLEIEPSLLGSRGTIEELVIHGNPELHLMNWQQELLSAGLQQVVQLG
ncbi:MAG: HRDC domain-containing protein [Prosthecobacter sp.]|jgi:ribonuclease D|uniref:ribonuclease D n=1 Tax=Prosthecobacter sp. TaxID=1965333 RepID=UPI0019F26C39|nr:ribonuclease D [Prosthecobacter sp.]MBE2284856.1 HRDC domain-containing protein [Prosthecobacter sp.]